MIPLSEAAKLAGKSKQALRKAVQSGRMSGVKDDKGVWLVDPAELERVYPLVAKGGRDEAPVAPADDVSTELAVSRAKVLMLQENLERERDRAEAAEKRLDTVLTQLTDQRPRRGWWPWGRK